MTIASKYIAALDEHRGQAAPSRAVTPYVADPYNMTHIEYSKAKKRIKAEYKEKNRAEQEKLNQSIRGAIRRKFTKRASFKEKKRKHLANLKTKYIRSKIDKEAGNVPGEWRSQERGKFPVGTQGKPLGKQGLLARTFGRTFGRRNVSLLAPPTKQPVGYLPQAHRSSRAFSLPSLRRVRALPAAPNTQPRLSVPPPPPPKGYLPPARPNSPRPQLPPRVTPRKLPSGQRQVAGLLPAARRRTVEKLRKKRS